VPTASRLSQPLRPGEGAPGLKQPLPLPPPLQPPLQHLVLLGQRAKRQRPRQPLASASASRQPPSLPCRLSHPTGTLPPHPAQTPPSCLLLLLQQVSRPQTSRPPNRRRPPSLRPSAGAEPSRPRAARAGPSSSPGSAGRPRCSKSSRPPNSSSALSTTSTRRSSASSSSWASNRLLSPLPHHPLHQSPHRQRATHKCPRQRHLPVLLLFPLLLALPQRHSPYRPMNMARSRSSRKSL
jgi:hypothetical protein